MRKKKNEKNDVKAEDMKVEKKLKGDSGVDCHYCYDANHMASDCMLQKKEDKKNKVKDEAYCVERLEELRAKAKNLSLVARDKHKITESRLYNQNKHKSQGLLETSTVTLISFLGWW